MHHEPSILPSIHINCISLMTKGRERKTECRSIDVPIAQRQAIGSVCFSSFTSLPQTLTLTLVFRFHNLVLRGVTANDKNRWVDLPKHSVAQNIAIRGHALKTSSSWVSVESPWRPRLHLHRYLIEMKGFAWSVLSPFWSWPLPLSLSLCRW